jgi:hypothetical protein
MGSPRIFRLLSALCVLAWSGWFFWLAWRALAHSHFWATSGPAFLPADMPEYIARVQQAIDWQTPLFYALLPLAAYGLWSILRLMRKTRAA